MPLQPQLFASANEIQFDCRAPISQPMPDAPCGRIPPHLPLRGIIDNDTLVGTDTAQTVLDGAESIQSERERI